MVVLLCRKAVTCAKVARFAVASGTSGGSGGMKWDGFWQPREFRRGETAWRLMASGAPLMRNAMRPSGSVCSGRPIRDAANRLRALRWHGTRWHLAVPGVPEAGSGMPIASGGNFSPGDAMAEIETISRDMSSGHRIGSLEMKLQSNEECIEILKCWRHSAVRIAERDHRLFRNVRQREIQ